MARGTLAKCLLILLAAVPPAAPNPFLFPPFTLPVFRSNMMLLPLKTDRQLRLYEDESPDPDTDTSSEPVEAGDGFSFAQLDVSRLPVTQAPAFTDEALIQANTFYRDWIRGELRRLRCQGHLTADGLKLVDLVGPKTILESGRTDGGWRAYRTLVLALFARSGGIMQQVKEVLVRHRATPAHQWREDRDENRVSACVTS